jgi:phthalate 4,5-dioxygenase oxygenase subunit
VRAWVPLDDEHMMFFSMSKRSAGNLRNGTDGGSQMRAVSPDGRTAGGLKYHPNGSGSLDRFQLIQDKRNDYLIDRDKQRNNESFTGIDGIPVQDAAATEGMGVLADRTGEHLGSSDAMVIRTRLRLLNAVKAFEQLGVVPPGVDDPDVYHVRSGGVILPRDADWVEATESLRAAFVDHPDLDPSIVGDNG